MKSSHSTDTAKYVMTAIQHDGEVVAHRESETSWGLSEAQAFFDKYKIGLYSGQVKHILIERVE